MPKKFDRAGMTYGRLTVVRFHGHNTHKQRCWECLCECGNTVVITGGSLTTGNATSCGCYLKERITKHGGYKKSSYNTWRAMMRRCYNQKDKDFPRYGAIGVIVQDSWHNYLNFVADMGEPEGTQTLHRLHPYGNYTKENCTWAWPTMQARDIRIPKRNKTGYIGVVIINGKFRAGITAAKKKHCAPMRNTIEEAIEDRIALEEKYWGHNG
jgi:hypothetical protein